MEKLSLHISRDLLKKDHPHLPRDFMKGEAVEVFASDGKKLLGQNGLVCHLKGQLATFELPATYIAILYKNAAYGIFMKAKGEDYQELYCKVLPLNRLEILEKIQNPGIFSAPGSAKLQTSAEEGILKIRCGKGWFSFEEGRLGEIGPLFWGVNFDLRRVNLEWPQDGWKIHVAQVVFTDCD